MKKILFLAVVAAFVLSGCKKEDPNPHYTAQPGYQIPKTKRPVR